MKSSTLIHFYVFAHYPKMLETCFQNNLKISLKKPVFVQTFSQFGFQYKAFPEKPVFTFSRALTVFCSLPSADVSQSSLACYHQKSLASLKVECGKWVLTCLPLFTTLSFALLYFYHWLKSVFLIALLVKSMNEKQTRIVCQHKISSSYFLPLEYTH